MPVVTITNLKGGTGKSTLCLALATTLKHWRHSVAVVDADPQGTITDFFEQARAKGNPTPTAVQVSSPGEIEETIERLAATHAVVIVDTPARLAAPTRHALLRSDLAIVPVLASTSSIRALRHMTPLLEGARKLLPSLRVLFVPNRIERGKVTELALGELKAHADSCSYEVWEGQFSKRCVHDKAELLGAAVVTLGDRAAADEVTQLTQNVMEAVA